MLKFCREIASLSAALAGIMTGVASAEEDWKPAKPRLMTEWGEKVSSTNAWAASIPDPQFVPGAALAGTSTGCGTTPSPAHRGPQPAKFAGKILVPFRPAPSPGAFGGRPAVHARRAAPGIAAALRYRRGLGRPASPASLRGRRLRMHALDQRRPGRLAHGRVRPIHVRRNAVLTRPIGRRGRCPE